MSRYRGVERFCRYRTPVALMLDKVFGPAPEPTAVENFRLARNAVANVLAVPAFDVQIIASETSGPAPLGVSFDIFSNSSFPTINRPLHECSFWIEYDDERNFINLPTDFPFGNSAGKTQGAIGLHVFPEAGTYLVKAYVYHHPTGKWGYKEHTITVLDADEYFLNKTVCLSPSGEFTGAPAGAAQVTSLSSAMSTLGSYADRRRLLLNGGEDVILDSTLTMNTSANFHINSYGTGKGRLVPKPGYASPQCIWVRGDPLNTIANIEVSGNYNPVTGTGDTYGVSGVFINVSKTTIYNCDISSVSSPIVSASNPEPSDIVIVDNIMTNWRNFGVYIPVAYTSGLVGNSIKQNPNAVSGTNGKEDDLTRGEFAGDGSTVTFVLENLKLYGEPSNLALQIRDDTTLIMGSGLEAPADYTLTLGSDAAFSGSTLVTPATHEVTLSSAAAVGSSLVYYHRVWADHGPIRTVEVFGFLYSQNDFATYTGWSSDGLAIQPCIRDNTALEDGTSTGMWSFINQNKCIGGTQVIGRSVQNDNAEQNKCDCIIESNYLKGDASTQNMVSLTGTDVTVRNNIAEQPDVATLTTGTFKAFCQITQSSTVNAEIINNPIIIINNTLACLQSTANNVGDVLMVNNLDNVMTNVTDLNNLLYCPDRPTPLPVQYVPLDPENYWIPLAGNPAIDAGTPNYLVWDDFAGALTGETVSIGAYDVVSTPAFELNFDASSSTIATFEPVTLLGGEKVRFDFKCLPATFRRILIDRNIAGGALDRSPVDFTASNTIDIDTVETLSISIDGDILSDGQNIESYMDNNIHTLELTIKEGLFAVYGTLGAAYTNALFYEGVIKNLEFDKFVEGELITVLKWNIDSGSITTEASVIGEADLTFVNFVEDDWSLS